MSKELNVLKTETTGESVEIKKESIRHGLSLLAL